MIPVSVFLFSFFFVEVWGQLKRSFSDAFCFLQRFSFCSCYDLLQLSASCCLRRVEVIKEIEEN